MSFYWIHVLWLLLIPIILGVWEARRRGSVGTQASHPKIVHAEASSRTLQLKAAQPERRRRAAHWRLWLGVALAILALARPQWGHLDEPVFDQAREIMIALDLSRSMLSPDVRPSRLERAKLLVTSLLQRLTGERVGLIVFSGTAFLQSPLSSDYEILNEFLPALNPDYLPDGGTNYEGLINTALSSFGSSSSADRYLIILSDGEATDENWKPAAEKLKTKGIRVIGLGVGTAAGSIMPDGSGGFIKDERGAVVLSKLEPGTLKDLAQLTGGVYVDASSWVDLAQLIQSTVATGQKGKFREERNVRLVERYQWALAPAFLLLLWSFWQEFPVYPRSRDIRLQGARQGLPPALPTPPRSAEPPPLPQSVAARLVTLMIGFALLSAGAPHLQALEAIPNPAPKVEPKSSSSTSTDTTAAPLSNLVGQFSARENLSAREFAELAETTVTYGERIRSAHQPLLEGPIRDGLAAVDAGRALDPRAADWDKFQGQLTQLLKDPPKPTPPPKDQKQDSSKDKSKQDQSKDDQSKQDKSKQDSSSDQSKDSQAKPAPPQSDPSKDQSKGSPSDSAQPPTPSPQNPSDKDQEQSNPDRKNNPDSSLGDMQKSANDRPTPPPTPNNASPETQKVGGASDAPDQSAKPTDPALAVPLQRLQQVKDGDSPVKLQQIIRGDKKTPAQQGKNW